MIQILILIVLPDFQKLTIIENEASLPIPEGVIYKPDVLLETF